MPNVGKLAVAALCWCKSTSGFVNYGTVYPLKIGLGLTSKNLSLRDNTSITLSPSTSVVTFDYGGEVAGFPFFHVSSLSSPAHLEVKYAEQFPALFQPQSDGPWTFSNGLSNTFRVETFNITSPGYFESFFVQGGQRWESVTLLTNGSITIDGVGFRATSQHTDVDALPGHLGTSNEVYNRIFDLGGRVVQVACIDAGNAPSTWEITHDGVLVRGQATAQSVAGVSAANYTLDFYTKIVRGGTGWRVASSVEPYGPYFVLTSSYPKNNSFVNTNRTLLPPNTLIFNYGWSIVNQSTLETPANQYYPLNFTVDEEKWYHVSTSIQVDGYQIELDGVPAAFVPLPPSDASGSFFGTASRYEGTWGFGGFQNHISYFKSATVTAKNESTVYASPMTANNTLAEYQVAPLDHSVCLDGAKRDRLVWIGDFYHTVRVIALSTNRLDYVLGTIDYVFSYQVQTGPYAGFVPISAGLGSRPETSDPSYAGLIDYQDLFLAGIGEYFRYTGDVEGLRPYWENIKKLAAAKLAFIDPSSGLVASSPAVPSPINFLGPVNGSAVTGLFAYTLQGLVPLADALQDSPASSLYSSTVSSLRDAINRELWNPDLGIYSLSTSDPGNFSLSGIAWPILSGAANASQAASSIAKLEDIRFAIGYLTTSSDIPTPNYQLAPNPSGFLLEALFKARRDFGIDTTLATTHLLDDLWGSMVNNDEYYSGASWEYVKPDGSPGIGLFTSLAHPWGAAPTYVLSEYLLGVSPTTAGYGNFTVKPMIGYLGLDEVSGRVPTPYGTTKVSWKTSGNKTVVDIEVPAGVTGILDAPEHMSVAGEEKGSRSVQLSGGRTTITLQPL